MKIYKTIHNTVYSVKRHSRPRPFLLAQLNYKIESFVWREINWDYSLFVSGWDNRKNQHTAAKVIWLS